MIHFQRSGSIAPGKTAAALVFAREAAAYIKSKTGLEVTVAMPVGGTPTASAGRSDTTTSPRWRTRRASCEIWRLL